VLVCVSLIDRKDYDRLCDDDTMDTMHVDDGGGGLKRFVQKRRFSPKIAIFFWLCECDEKEGKRAEQRRDT